MSATPLTFSRRPAWLGRPLLVGYYLTVAAGFYLVLHRSGPVRGTLRPLLAPVVGPTVEELTWLWLLVLCVFSGDLVQGWIRRRCGECRIEDGVAHFQVPSVGAIDVTVRLRLADIRERWITPHGVRVETGRRNWASRTSVPLLIPTRDDAEVARVIAVIDAKAA